MTNPFNQSRFRNEHELGSAYKVVSEVHDQLDIINFLAQNLEGVRSGNIELKSDEEGKIYWKYVKSEEWVFWGDLAELFEPLVASLQENQGEQAGRLDQLQSEIETIIQRLDADIAALGDLSDTVQSDQTALNTLTLEVAQNTQDILTIQGELQTLASTSTAYGTRLDSLENSLTNLDSALNTLQDSLEPRLTAIENVILGIQNAITDVTNRLELLENG